MKKFKEGTSRQDCTEFKNGYVEEKQQNRSDWIQSNLNLKYNIFINDIIYILFYLLFAQITNAFNIC